jgi:hypothetical protein
MATTTAAPEQGAEAATGRKYKASDLPLPSATRAAIEFLAKEFKKKGDYDVIRKQVWESFETSVRQSRCLDPYQLYS